MAIGKKLDLGKEKKSLNPTSDRSNTWFGKGQIGLLGKASEGGTPATVFSCLSQAGCLALRPGLQPKNAGLFG
jgi:hypothetical protein